MKTSKYNYYVPFKEGIVFMNGITEASFWADDKFADTFRQIIESPNDYPEYDGFLSKMQHQGFILEDEADEAALVEAKYRQLRQPEEYRVMILPTYQCNLRCWYCVQEHENSWMTDECVARVKQLLVKRLENPEIKRLNISWFGGEPLMAYDKLLEITRYAKELARSQGKDFICSITTNGTLLTEKRIDELCEAGVTYYQITIDGEQAKHDTVKKLGGKSAFDTTLKNIAYLAKDTHCMLRFNYTRDTMNPKLIARQVADRLSAEVRHNVTLNLQPVWQTIDKDHIEQDEVIEMMDLFKSMGITPSLKPIGLCYVDFKHYECIYPDGTIGKCNNGDNRIKPGILQNNGAVNNEQADTVHFSPSYEDKNSECVCCNYLPLCWGPCTQKRFSQLKEKKHLFCFWSDKTASMKEAIINTHLTQKYLAKQD